MGDPRWEALLGSGSSGSSDRTYVSQHDGVAWNTLPDDDMDGMVLSRRRIFDLNSKAMIGDMTTLDWVSNPQLR
eukprot:15442999-Heterocapsa_arctica.AAC.1